MTLKPWPTTLTDSCFYLTNMAVNIWTGIWTIWSKESLHGASWNKCTRALTHETEGWIENDSQFKSILSWYSFFFLLWKFSSIKNVFVTICLLYISVHFHCYLKLWFLFFLKLFSMFIILHLWTCIYIGIGVFFVLLYTCLHPQRSEKQ